jgi:hypothetical protein
MGIVYVLRFLRTGSQVEFQQRIIERPCYVSCLVGLPSLCKSQVIFICAAGWNERPLGHFYFIFLYLLWLIIRWKKGWVIKQKNLKKQRTWRRRVKISQDAMKGRHCYNLQLVKSSQIRSFLHSFIHSYPTVIIALHHAGQIEKSKWGKNTLEHINIIKFFFFNIYI